MKELQLYSFLLKSASPIMLGVTSRKARCSKKRPFKTARLRARCPKTISPVIHDLVVAISVPFEKWAGRRNNQNTSTNDLWILFISSHVMSLKSVFHFLRKSLMMLHENPFMSLVVSAAVPTFLTGHITSCITIVALETKLEGEAFLVFLELRILQKGLT